MKKALVGVVTKDLITYTTENRGHSCSVDRLAQSGCVCQPAQIACSKKELVILSTSSLGKLVKARSFQRLSLLLVFSFFPATFSRFSNRYSSRHLVRVYKGCEVHSRGGVLTHLRGYRIHCHLDMQSTPIHQKIQGREVVPFAYFNASEPLLHQGQQLDFPGSCCQQTYLCHIYQISISLLFFSHNNAAGSADRRTFGRELHLDSDHGFHYVPIKQNAREGGVGSPQHLFVCP